MFLLEVIKEAGLHLAGLIWCQKSNWEQQIRWVLKVTVSTSAIVLTEGGRHGGGF